MDDFNQALQSLTAADLSFLQPVAPAATSRPESPATVAEGKKQRRRRNPSAASAKAMPESETAAIPVDPPTIPQSDTAVVSAKLPPTVATSDASQDHEDEEADDNDDDSTDALVKEGGCAPGKKPPRRKRTCPAREWPAVGTRLVAEYFGAIYRAEIVAAKKRLKSGRQVKLLDGPSAGKRCNSLSKAMALATARQSRQQKLDRRGISSGWTFWKRELPDGKTESLDMTGVRA